MRIAAAAFALFLSAPAAARCAAAPTSVSADGPVHAVPSLAERVRRLEDREEIHDLIIDYGRTLDAGDFAGYAALFAADGDWTGAPFGTLRGPAAIQSAMEARYKVAPGSFHLLTNDVITVHGDRATAVSKWDFISPVDGRPAIFAAGRYDDEFVREHGRWKFLHRVVSANFGPPGAPATK